MVLTSRAIEVLTSRLLATQRCGKSVRRDRDRVRRVARVALDGDGEQIPIDDASAFSEMAMYVLVRRDGMWWLAAGQNTPIRPTP